MINANNFEDKDKTDSEENDEEQISINDSDSNMNEQETDLNSDENSSDNLTSSMLSLNNDLNSSTISINEEENYLLNNYKYDSDPQENIDITIENFIKLTQTHPELIDTIVNVRKNINLLPDLMKTIKLHNHKLALNLMDDPGFCFEKIFDILFNKSDNINDHKDSIDKILEVFPYYSIEEVFDIFKSCSYNVDLTIEKLCY